MCICVPRAIVGFWCFWQVRPCKPLVLSAWTRHGTVLDSRWPHFAASFSKRLCNEDNLRQLYTVLCSDRFCLKSFMSVDLVSSSSCGSIYCTIISRPLPPFYIFNILCCTLPYYFPPAAWICILVFDVAMAHMNLHRSLMHGPGMLTAGIHIWRTHCSVTHVFVFLILRCLPFLPAVKPERDRRLDVACVWTFLLIQLSENTARNGGIWVLVCCWKMSWFGQENCSYWVRLIGFVIARFF